MAGKRFTTIDDIEREKETKSREEFKGKVSQDIREILGGIFEPPKKPKKKKNWFFEFIKWIGILFLGLFIINFILGNIWLLKTLVKSLFFGD